jgi:hypothetical protein
MFDYSVTVVFPIAVIVDKPATQVTTPLNFIPKKGNESTAVAVVIVKDISPRGLTA